MKKGPSNSSDLKMQLIPPSLPTGDPSPQIQDGCPQGSSPCRCPGVCKGREMHLGAIKVFLGEMGKRDNRYIIKFLLIFQVIEKCPVPSFLGQGDPMIHAMVGLSTLPLGKHITGNAHLNQDFIKLASLHKWIVSQSHYMTL